MDFKKLLFYYSKCVHPILKALHSHRSFQWQLHTSKSLLFVGKACIFQEIICLAGRTAQQWGQSRAQSDMSCGLDDLTPCLAK